MGSSDSAISKLLHELRRRRVFRTAGYYVVGAWLALQAGEVLFPGFGIPERAIGILFWASVIGFPLALVFGWFFDLSASGIRRTAPATGTEEAPAGELAARDWIVLSALVVIAGVIVWRTTQEVIDAPTAEPSESAAAPAPSEPEQPEKLEHSVAVLPFDNLSNDPDNAYFCDGMADEILTTLGRFAGLNVIGRTSSFAFRYDRPPAPRISDLLGARYLLQGSVRKMGDRVRISTQLLDERGVQVWSENYDRDLADAFALQSEIAEIVALTVAPRVAPGAAQSHEPDPVAYDHFLRGREAFYRRDRPAAIREFERAIELDPAYAEAHVELAAMLAMGVTRAEQLQRSRRHLDRARALDPGNARASAVEGLLLSSLPQPDLAGAERALREALARDPDMVDALNWLGVVLQRRGNREAAGVVLERGVRLDPLHPVLAINVAQRLIGQGRSAEAERRLERLVGIPGIGRFPYQELMALYRAQGRLADRYAMGNRMLRDTQPDVHYMIAESEILLGRWERGSYWYGLDVAAVDDPDYPAYRKPAFRHLGTGVLAMRGRFDEAHAALLRDPLYREDRFAGQSPILVIWLGIIPGLAGDCEATRGLLAPLLFPEGPASLDTEPLQDRDWQNAVHTFAWCLRQLGEGDGADAVLERLEAAMDQRANRVVDVGSEIRFFSARNAALSGDLDLAVERFEGAIEAGWRSLNWHAREPFWANLRADPRATPLLARIEADIAAERAKAEAMDAEWDPVEWHRRSRALASPGAR